MPRKRAGWLTAALVGCLAGLGIRGDAGQADDAVRVWEEDLVLPAYQLEPPDPNPMFYRGESYQGAQRRIYPYPLLDGLTGIRREQAFRAVYLENEYIKLCVLPEIGGRLFYATDKSNGYDFFYRQHVIKPALIGMLGAWISGGIEWCVFHHHRNTTHMPVNYTTQAHSDGSKTIWIGETERRHRMRWAIGITLRPGRSFIEARVRMLNRTPMPHSILYWANVAVSVNDDYQVIFPPSVRVATYHAKNDFVHWPIGRGFYRGRDYNGVDLSWWKNHPGPVSCFAWDLQEDFMGGYDHGRRAGVVHVANHHIVCGAKLWEWGPNNIWDTQVLTDSDGPYAELMVGAFSDNQPDYSWIKPYEIKQFTQYWYPIREIGGIKNANREAAVNLDIRDGRAYLGFHTTGRRPRAKGRLLVKGKAVWQAQLDLAPDRPFVHSVALPKGTASTEVKVELRGADGHTIISYQPVERPPVERLPEPVKPPPPPEAIAAIEELYLTGLRIEQIHNPRLDPTRYYEEALRRDPDDVRCNLMMGIICNRRMQYVDAERYLRRALRRLTADYTRPKDGEVFYQLGLALKAQGRWTEAYDAFYRASWDAAQKAAAYYQLATLSCRRGDFRLALKHLAESLAVDQRNHRALNLRAGLWRRAGRVQAALQLTERLLERDPLDIAARWERYLAHRNSGDVGAAEATWQALLRITRNDPQAWLELATDYMEWGLWDEAILALESSEHARSKDTAGSPLTAYYLGYLYLQKGQQAKARAWFREGSQRPLKYCFPFREETAAVLEAALKLNPKDGRAWYYLGNLYYERQPERAIDCWEKARALEPKLGIVYRNLGWAYAQHRQDMEGAIASYEKAIQCQPDDPRYYLELDDLYEQANTDPARRLAMLNTHPEVIEKRKDLLIRRIDLLVINGRYDAAIGLLNTNQFFVSEGGGEELGNAYVDAYLLRGHQRLEAGRAREALADFKAAARYPANLSQETPRNEPRMAQVNYLIALALQALGEKQEAHAAFERVVAEDGDVWEHAQYYRALALKALGREEEALKIAEALVTTAQERFSSTGGVDYFAKFGGPRSQRLQRADAHYQWGLGLLLQGRKAEAAREFQQALELNKAHVWARWELERLRASK